MNRDFVISIVKCFDSIAFLLHFAFLFFSDFYLTESVPEEEKNKACETVHRLDLKCNMFYVLLCFKNWHVSVFFFLNVDKGFLFSTSIQSMNKIGIAWMYHIKLYKIVFCLLLKNHSINCFLREANAKKRFFFHFPENRSGCAVFHEKSNFQCNFYGFFSYNLKTWLNESGVGSGYTL